VSGVIAVLKTQNHVNFVAIVKRLINGEKESGRKGRELLREVHWPSRFEIDFGIGGFFFLLRLMV
jgi:hypothetical protein